MSIKQYEWVYRRGYVPLHTRILKDIKKEMRRRKMTITQVATELGCSRPYLSNVLNGKNEPSIYVLESLLELFDRRLVIEKRNSD